MSDTCKRIILKPAGLDNARSARLTKELAAAVELQNQLCAHSPHVLQFTDRLCESETAYIIEHEPARPLEVAPLFDRRLPLMEAQRLLQIAAALFDVMRATHATTTPRPVVHGGLCPGVLLFGADGIDKVSDFGFAPAICAALGAEAYANLAVGPCPQIDEAASAVWQVLPREIEDRDERICSFIDPDKYRSKSLQSFPPSADIAASAFILHLLAERRHPYFHDYPEAHRILDVVELMAMARAAGITRKDLLDSPDPAIRLWCDLVREMMVAVPQNRPTAVSLSERLSQYEGPANLEKLLRGRLEQACALLNEDPLATPWGRIHALVSAIGRASDIPVDLREQATALANLADAGRRLEGPKWSEAAANTVGVSGLPTAAQPVAEKMLNILAHNQQLEQQLNAIEVELGQITSPDSLPAVDSLCQQLGTLTDGRNRPLLNAVQQKMDRLGRDAVELQHRLQSEARERLHQELTSKLELAHRYADEDRFAETFALLGEVEQQTAFAELSAQAGQYRQRVVELEKRFTEHQDQVRQARQRADQLLAEAEQAIEQLEPHDIGPVEKLCEQVLAIPDASESQRRKATEILHFARERQAEQFVDAKRRVDWLSRMEKSIRQAQQHLDEGRFLKAFRKASRLAGLKIVGIEEQAEQIVQQAAIEIDSRRRELRERLKEAEQNAGQEALHDALDIAQAVLEDEYADKPIAEDARRLVREFQAALEKIEQQRKRAVDDCERSIAALESDDLISAGELANAVLQNPQAESVVVADARRIAVAIAELTAAAGVNEKGDYAAAMLALLQMQQRKRSPDRIDSLVVQAILKLRKEIDRQRKQALLDGIEQYLEARAALETGTANPDEIDAKSLLPDTLPQWLRDKLGELERFLCNCSAVVRHTGSATQPAPEATQPPGRAMSPREIAQALIPFAQALNHAHAQDMLHGDITPRIVNLNQDNAKEPRQGEFDLAQVISLGEQRSSLGLRGTPGYIAPEVITSMGEEMDSRSDIFSLGCVLYELLTDQPPFGAVSSVALSDGTGHPSISGVLLNTLRYRFTPLIQAASQVPQSLRTICEKAMAREPKDRYSQARLLADDLGRFLSWLDREQWQAELSEARSQFQAWRQTNSVQFEQLDAIRTAVESLHLRAIDDIKEAAAKLLGDMDALREQITASRSEAAERLASAQQSLGAKAYRVARNEAQRVVDNPYVPELHAQAREIVAAAGAELAKAGKKSLKLAAIALSAAVGVMVLGLGAKSWLSGNDSGTVLADKPQIAQNLSAEPEPNVAAPSVPTEGTKQEPATTPEAEPADWAAPTAKLTTTLAAASSKPRIEIGYQAADEDGGSGLKAVHLLVKRPGPDRKWEDTQLRPSFADNLAAGSFEFAFGDEGAYSFALQAEDNSGNRPPPPESDGGVTIYDKTPPEINNIQVRADSSSASTSDTLLSVSCEVVDRHTAVVKTELVVAGSTPQILKTDPQQGRWIFSGSVPPDSVASLLTLRAEDQAGNTSERQVSLPTISSHPESTAFCAGDKAELRVVAQAATDQSLRYQWWHARNGESPVRLDGRTDAILGIEAVKKTDEGSYYCEIGGGDGITLRSRTAVLTVNEPPVLGMVQKEWKIEQGKDGVLDFTIETVESAKVQSVSLLKVDQSPTAATAIPVSTERYRIDPGSGAARKLTIMSLQAVDGGRYRVIAKSADECSGQLEFDLVVLPPSDPWQAQRDALEAELDRAVATTVTLESSQAANWLGRLAQIKWQSEAAAFADVAARTKIVQDELARRTSASPNLGIRPNRFVEYFYGKQHVYAFYWFADTADAATQPVIRAARLGTTEQLGQEIGSLLGKPLPQDANNQASRQRLGESLLGPIVNTEGFFTPTTTSANGKSCFGVVLVPDGLLYFVPLHRLPFSTSASLTVWNNDPVDQQDEEIRAIGTLDDCCPTDEQMLWCQSGVWTMASIAGPPAGASYVELWGRLKKLHQSALASLLTIDTADKALNTTSTIRGAYFCGVEETKTAVRAAANKACGTYRSQDAGFLGPRIDYDLVLISESPSSSAAAPP